jgi:pyruvate formate lyase activating enzyme
MNIPYIFDIQRFSIHDGPGIRTTVFFKGCPLNCTWCHNPEGQNYLPEYWEKKDGQQELVGKQYSVNELIKELEKDRIFYEQSGGGITLSGGEVMTQNRDYLEELTKTLYDKGISIVIDTCGMCDFACFECVLPYTDLFLYDLKLLDDNEHQYFTGSSNRIILENLRKLSERNVKISLRLIMIENINSDEEHIENLLAWLHDNNIRPTNIDLLPYHELGKDKYLRLQKQKAVIFKTPTEKRLQEIREILTTT